MKSIVTADSCRLLSRLLLLLLACLPGAGCSWVKVSTSGPAARSGHAMAFDSSQGHVLLFGGRDKATQYNDTWEWNDSSSSWVQQTPAAAPSPRAFHAMASDTDRHRVVLFGGAAGPVDSDETWEWDGNQWTQLNPAHKPPGRHHHAMAYDAVRKKVVLFGGYSSGSADTPRADLDDTWLWDGTDWTSGPKGPPARDGLCMAFDARQSVIVMYGGAQDINTLTYLQDTWQWDGTSWANVSAPPPPARASLAATYDAPAQMVVIFGGFDGTSYYNDTVAWNGTQWIMTTFNTKPDPRKDHAMAYDPKTGNIVMFGGMNGAATFFGDTWELKKQPLLLARHRAVPIKVP